MDDLGLSAETVGASSLFSGDEEMFAFARCVSRLSQMGYVFLSEMGVQDQLLMLDSTKEWAEGMQ